MSLVGFDLGGAVAAGFAAKHLAQCLSLSLLGPVGVSHSTALPEGLLRSAPLPLARLAMTRWGPQGLLRQVQRDFFDLEQATTHRHLVDKQEAMLRWQLSSSPG